MEEEEDMGLDFFFFWELWIQVYRFYNVGRQVGRGGCDDYGDVFNFGILFDVVEVRWVWMIV